MWPLDGILDNKARQRHDSKERKRKSQAITCIKLVTKITNY